MIRGKEEGEMRMEEEDSLSVVLYIPYSFCLLAAFLQLAFFGSFSVQP